MTPVSAGWAGDPAPVTAVRRLRCRGAGAAHRPRRPRCAPPEGIPAAHPGPGSGTRGLARSAGRRRRGRPHSGPSPRAGSRESGRCARSGDPTPSSRAVSSGHRLSPALTCPRGPGPTGRPARRRADAAAAGESGVVQLHWHGAFVVVVGIEPMTPCWERRRQPVSSAAP